MMGETSDASNIWSETADASGRVASPAPTQGEAWTALGLTFDIDPNFGKRAVGFIIDTHGQAVGLHEIRLAASAPAMFAALVEAKGALKTARDYATDLMNGSLVSAQTGATFTSLGREDLKRFEDACRAADAALTAAPHQGEADSRNHSCILSDDIPHSCKPLPDSAGVREAIVACRAVVATKDLSTAQAMGQVALDYLTQDEEALAEGRSYALTPAEPKP